MRTSYNLGGKSRTKMALESLKATDYIRQLVEERRKTHKEVSIILTQTYPGVVGLSERTVRRFCAKHNIHLLDRCLSTADLDAVVSRLPLLR